jgi:hypothetical protein
VMKEARESEPGRGEMGRESKWDWARGARRGLVPAGELGCEIFVEGSGTGEEMLRPPGLARR